VPPGYEIVKIEGNRVEVKDLKTGYITPYGTNFDKDTVITPVMTDTEDELPRQWYYFERLAVLPWYATAVGADLNHSGVGEIYGWASGVTYLDTISSGWNFEHIGYGDRAGPDCWGDTDNDDLLELFTADNTRLILYESRDYYSYPDSQIWILNHNTYSDLANKLGDLDNDGYGEVLFYPGTRIGYQIHETDDNGNYIYKTEIRFWDYVHDWVGEPSFGDIDGDGLTEIFAGGIHGEVIVFENVADDSFEFVWQYQLSEPSAYVSEYLGDTDGDGLNEFMIAAMDLFGGSGILFSIFEAAGNNSYQNVYNIVVERYSLSRGDIVVGDFIEGGLNEIALCTGKNIVILLAESDNEWVERLRFKSSIRSSEIYFYQRLFSEPAVILSVIWYPTWQSYLLKVMDAFIPGDVNNNNIVNGNDVVHLVAYIKEGGDIDEPIIRADANGDCEVNLLDVSYLVDYFKGRLPAPEPGWCPYLDE